MNASERRVTLVLAAILILRMTALFMVLPVLAPYALNLAGHPMLAVGLAVGAYGFTQAILQIPLGWLSDRIGRKPVIVAGLVVFAAGSVMAAFATTIDGLVWARLLQGGGAIAAACTALLSDLTRESVRTTAMAIIGVSIGCSFLLALVLGPALLSFTDVPGLFVMSSIAAIAACFLLLALPTPPHPSSHPAPASTVWQGDLLRLDLGVFCLHAVLAALFLGLPLMLIEHVHLPAERHWHIYLPVMIASLLPIFPLIRYLEQRDAIVAGMPFAVAALVLACSLLGTGLFWVPAVLWVFFCAFNFLEASLPAMVSRMAPGATRGRAMGVFSSAQFFGAFCGAALGGWVLTHWGARAVILSAAAWGALWLLALLVRNSSRIPLSSSASQEH